MPRTTVAKRAPLRTRPTRKGSATSTVATLSPSSHAASTWGATDRRTTNSSTSAAQSRATAFTRWRSDGPPSVERMRRTKA